VTQWTTPSGGRERGLSGLISGWIQVLTRPRSFFRCAVSPGDQGPALAFVVCVTAIAAAEFVAFETVRLPGGDTPATPMAALLVAVIAMLVAPTALHLVAAVQTVILAATVPNRAGVSETVQVVAYATAPCVLAGLPVPIVRVLATGYAAVLLAVGVATVHRQSLPRAAVLAAVPASLAFGYGFGGFAGAATILSKAGIPSSIT
jgi:hypothetical protein